MKDLSVNSTARIEQEVRPVQSQPASPPVQGVQTGAANPAQSAKPAAPEKPSENAAVSQSSMADVFLKFRVDEKTRDVTVYVVDRASKQVVRTIPPKEMKNLKAGDLVSLLA